MTTPGCPICKKPVTGRGRTCSRSCGLFLANREGRIKHSRPFGDKNPNWKGGRKLDADGYVLVRWPLDHPRAGRRRKYILEHRLVMERHLGRPLKDYEIVHHRNGVKDDNRLSNLEIVTHARPNGYVECPHCQETFLVH